MAERVEPNKRLDRYLAAFALALRAFADSRDWDRHHTPRNLAIAVFSEAGELASEFRWTEEPDKSRVEDELADVFIFTCILADRMDINLAQAARDKVANNAEKYPPAPFALDYELLTQATPALRDKLAKCPPDIVNVSDKEFLSKHPHPDRALRARKK